MSLENIDWVAVRAEAEAEVIADKTAEILADADAYECVACCIESQLCDVGLAVRVERERIIKLIQDDDYYHLIENVPVVVSVGEAVEYKTRHSCYCVGCLLIARIKGEQK